MGFFNKMFSFMGFENSASNAANEEKKQKPSKIKSSFQLNSKNKKEKAVQTKKLASEQDISEVIDLIKKQNTIIIDLSAFDKEKKVRAFDFISGAVFALEGQIEKIKPNVYICSLDELNYFLGESE
jgi:cell division inhibitor SepF